MPRRRSALGNLPRRKWAILATWPTGLRGGRYEQPMKNAAAAKANRANDLVSILYVGDRHSDILRIAAASSQVRLARAEHKLHPLSVGAPFR